MKLHIPDRMHGLVMDHARTHGWVGKNLASARAFLDAKDLPLLPRRMHRLPKDVSADLWRTPTERRKEMVRREERSEWRELAFIAAQGAGPRKTPEVPCFMIPDWREKQKEARFARGLEKLLTRIRGQRIPPVTRIMETAKPKIITRYAGDPRP